MSWILTAVMCVSLPGFPAKAAPVVDAVLETGPAVSVQDALDSLGTVSGTVQVNVYANTLGSGEELFVPADKGIGTLILKGQGGIITLGTDVYANGVPLEIEDLKLSRVFGGGLDRDTVGGTSVTVRRAGSLYCVYGGGRVSYEGLAAGKTATVTGDTYVEVQDCSFPAMSDAQIAGGGLLASVDGNTEVVVDGVSGTTVMVMGGCALRNDLPGAGVTRPGYPDATGHEPDVFISGNTDVKVTSCAVKAIAGNTALDRRSGSSKQDGYMGTAEVRGSTKVFVGDGTTFSEAIVGNAYLPLDDNATTIGATPVAPYVYDLQNAKAYVRQGSVVEVGSDGTAAVQGTGSANMRYSKVLGGSYTANGQTGTDGDIQVTVKNAKNLLCVFGGSWSGNGAYSEIDYASNSYEVVNSQDIIQGDITGSVDNSEMEFFVASSAVEKRSTYASNGAGPYDLKKYNGTAFVPVEDLAKVAGNTAAELDGVQFGGSILYPMAIAGAGRGNTSSGGIDLEIQGDLSVTARNGNIQYQTGSIVGGLCGQGMQTGDVRLELDRMSGTSTYPTTIGAAAVYAVYGTYHSRSRSTNAAPTQKTDGNLTAVLRDMRADSFYTGTSAVLGDAAHGTGNVSITVVDTDLNDLAGGMVASGSGEGLVAGDISIILGESDTSNTYPANVYGAVAAGAMSSNTSLASEVLGDITVDLPCGFAETLMACGSPAGVASGAQNWGSVTVNVGDGLLPTSDRSVVRAAYGNSPFETPGSNCRINFLRDSMPFIGTILYWDELEIGETLHVEDSIGGANMGSGMALQLRGVWNSRDVAVDYVNASSTSGTPPSAYLKQGWTGTPTLQYRTGTGTAAQWYLDGPFSSVRVSFDPNGGDWAGDTAVKTVSAPLTSVNIPADPAKSGFSFGGWYTDLSDPATKLDPAAPSALTADTTYYAKWQRSPSVTFRIAYGTWAGGSRADQTVITVGGTLDPADVPVGMLPDPGCTGGTWDAEPDTASGGITADTTYTYSFQPIRSSAEVTFQIVGGTWRDGTSADLRVSVPTLAGIGTLDPANVPAGMFPDTGYTGGAWDTEPNTSPGGVTGSVTYTYRFTPIVSDATVRFQVVNGTWSDGTGTDILLTVPLLGGTGTLSAADVPTGMLPDSGCAGGAWNVVPDTSPGGITANTTYIYSFVPLVSSAEVTFRVVNGTWADGTEMDKIVTVALALGKGTLSEADVPSGMIPHLGYGSGIWLVQPDTSTGDITGDVTYTYRFLPVPLASVTFRIVNGTWADGTRTDRVVVVPLAGGGGTLPEADVPSGMKPNRGYTGGTWDTEPNTEPGGITGDVVYTYSFTPSVAPPPVGDTYTLTYETNGGRPIDPERYSGGTVVKLSKQPLRAGYIFAGWYLDESLLAPVTQVTMNGDMTVYAKWMRGSVPDGLNGEEHKAYVTGYPDGTVRPNARITRAEVAVIFYRLLDEGVRDKAGKAVAGFSDVEPGSWYAEAVKALAGLDILEGYEDGTFRGNRAVTRAEFAAIASRFSSREYAGEDLFTDISGHWARNSINRAASSGWIVGYSDGTFGPDKSITRAEAMSLINNVLLRMPEDADSLLASMKKWPDNMDPAKWYYLAVQEATNSHEYTRKADSVHEAWTKLI